MMEIESEISRQNGMLQLTLIEIQITSYIYKIKDSKRQNGMHMAYPTQSI